MQSQSDSTQHYQWHAAASALFFAGRYEEADAACDRTLSEMPRYPGALRLKVARSGLLGNAGACPRIKSECSLFSVKCFRLKIAAYLLTVMQSASAGPGVLLHAAESTSPCLEITIVAPGQVTETSRSPGLQLKSQLLLGAHVP